MAHYSPKNLLFLWILMLLTGAYSCFRTNTNPRILIFTKTEFHIEENTAIALEAIKTSCSKNNIQLDVADDSEVFTEDNLHKYAAVVFLNTIGDVLENKEQIEFERFIQAGGGFVGIHSAMDTERSWNWFGGLLGAVYDGKSEVKEATLHTMNSQSPATKQLPKTWQRRDEWFNLRNFDQSARVLLSLDETSCACGTMGALHPVSWQHNYDGGRAFVTTMGHTAASYDDPKFLAHLIGAFQYAIGDNKPLHFKAHRKPAVARGNGFVKTTLLSNLCEPMEMDMLPDGKILFIERQGAIKLFNPENNSAKVLGTLDVFLENEEGLTGMALDPDWSNNHWVYLFYSPAGDKAETRLSRFVLDGEKFDSSSEKIILDMPSERIEPCHHGGGSLEFDSNGDLYIGIGDNSIPYDLDGYTPIDERPGRFAWDAQRTSGNTMGLHGKILRIKPLPDGSYECPAGNLFVQKNVRFTAQTRHLLDDPFWASIVNPNFPNRADDRHAMSGTALKGAPEVYAMGCRNPFRFSIDDRRHLLVWGDVGCDAGEPDSTRGPEGYDEINWTRTAGFFGWPYFIADNQPFRAFDFDTRKPGPAFNPAMPLNESPNNTGACQLPPARPSGIWYPYQSTAAFPLLGNGTRCAMAGPVYYCDAYPEETRFPDRFDGKVLIFDWMRNWIMAVELDSLDRYVGMEAVAPTVSLTRPTYMMIDKKSGALWVLEYGSEWYTGNPDACLSRIDFVRGDDIAGQPNPLETDQEPIHWELSGKNRSFYHPGEVVHYAVRVNETASANPQANNLEVCLDYLEPGMPLHQLIAANTTVAPGKQLIDKSDCKSCHDLHRKINGPAFDAIAQHYSGDKSAAGTLVQKVIKGGDGVWGKQMMSAHPQLKEKDVREMVSWILEQNKPGHGLPAAGEVELRVPDQAGKKAGGNFVFTAHPASGDKPAVLVLQPVLQRLENADSISSGVRRIKPHSSQPNVALELRNHSFFVFKHIDLYGVTSVDLALLRNQTKPLAGGRIELHLSGPEGKLVGSVAIPQAKAETTENAYTEIKMPIEQRHWPADGPLQDLYFVAKTAQGESGSVAVVDWIRFGL
ncbi:MAG: ThuA domain-containing protein [Lewinellaceae bacterium]|nr:ThuA domain-containing protein [Lewinellaceae bacterium]